jgi:hypothetical protein
MAAARAAHHCARQKSRHDAESAADGAGRRDLGIDQILLLSGIPADKAHATAGQYGLKNGDLLGSGRQ